MTTKAITTGGFFGLFARKALEKVQISEDVDPEIREVLEHVKQSSIEALGGQKKVEAEIVSEKVEQSGDVVEVEGEPVAS